MIKKKEIEQKAELLNVPKSTIDKDWVLGHFIDAIYSIPICRESLIFKGGTCLRKCYFSNYRFSEDLDFTSTNSNFIFDKKLLKQIADLITERTEIQLHINELTELKSNDRLMGFRATIKFWGADHPANQTPPPPDRWNTSIKIEIIQFEKLIFPSENKEVFHEYSDGLSENPFVVPCYSLKEVLSEKLRALIQRSYTAPRDYYDIWHLSNSQEIRNWDEITDAFYQKMDFKNIPFQGVYQMINENNDKRVGTAWKNSLAHQIPRGLNISYEEVRNDLFILLSRIFEK